MATAAYIDDVLSLAYALRELPATEALLAAAPDPGAEDEISFDVTVYADELRPALALHQALQLSADAAALYIETAEEGRELDRDFATAFLAERPVELLVRDLGTGSFRGRYTLNPKTLAGRRRLFALGGLTATGLVLTGVLAPVGLVIAGGVGFANEFISPDDKPAVQLQTVDPADAQQAQIEVRVDTTEPGEHPAVPQRRVYVYDACLRGSTEANEAFLSQVHALDGVERQSRFLATEPGESQRLRIWSAGPLDLDSLRATAEELGIEVVDLKPIAEPG